MTMTPATQSPTEPFADGRDTKGRFAPGNAGGPGNPHAARVAALRSSFMRAATPEDVADVVAAVVKEAKAGNMQAARLYLDRALGPIEATDLLARLGELEDAVGAALEARGARGR